MNNFNTTYFEFELDNNDFKLSIYNEFPGFKQLCPKRAKCIMNEKTNEFERNTRLYNKYLYIKGLFNEYAEIMKLKRKLERDYERDGEVDKFEFGYYMGLINKYNKSLRS